MIDLQECQEYSLSTEHKSNTSLFFVKLTDSALESIEQYLKLKDKADDSSSKPSIEFQNNVGTISLPLNGTTHKYGFTLSNIEGVGLQSSFQCIQQTSDSSLESLGSMLMKMQINAKEDSYEKTKFKMAAADQEQKSFCTKEIKQNGSGLGSKFKRKIEFVLPPVKSRPVLKKQQVKNKNMKPEILVHLPLRERVIHILAAKPYKRPELVVRLMKEGITERDKRRISDILTNVGTIKGNIYSLANHMWDEVNENWRFCSDEELQLIQKQKEHFLKLKDGKEVPGSKILTNGSLVQTSVSSEPHQLSSVTADKLPGNRQEFSNSPKVNDVWNGIIPPKKKIAVSCKKDLSFNGKLEKLLNGKDNNLSVSMETSNSAAECSTLESSLPQKLKKKKVRRRAKKTSTGSVSSIAKKNGKVPNMSLINFIPASKCSEDGAISRCQVKEAKASDCIKEKNNTPVNDTANINSLSNGNLSTYVNNTSINGLSNINSLSNENLSTYVNNTNINGLSDFDTPAICSPIFNGNSALPSQMNNEKSIGSDKEIFPIMDFATDFFCSEIKQKYTTIQSVEQRIQYVKDFNADYEEYLRLHAEIKEVSEKFATLFNDMHASVKGSVVFKEIGIEIAKEYKRAVKNGAYIPARKKYDLLKSKLSHIRNLVLEYDSVQNVES